MLKARDIQTETYRNFEIHYNAQIGPKEIEKYCDLDEASQNVIKIALEKLNISARAYDRILKVARRIADLENADVLHSAHIAEAIPYRR